MRLSSLFGLNARIRRLRIAAAEGALAAEDRVQLLRMAWEDEKQRLKLLLVFSLAVLGLTTVTVALLSVAVVVHFWETPHRIVAAWSVAGVWIVLWLAAAIGLLLFGKRLPEVGRGLGKSIVEFKKGLAGIEDEIDPSVGFITDVKIGDRVDAGDSLGTVYCDDAAKAKEAVHALQSAYEIGDEPVAELLLVKEVINE